MKIQSTKYNNPAFRAIPLAKYNYFDKKDQNVTVYQLEKSDVGYLRGISDNIEKFYKKHDINDFSTKQVVEEAVNAGIKILEAKHNPEEKAKVMLALCENEPSAILIGNVLKTDNKGLYHYSSRKNHAKDETELDWLATWNKNILGEGKVIVNEYFHTLAKDGFKQVYVRSEIPENSFAKNFYEKMGFEPLSEDQREIIRKNDNKYLIGSFDEPDDYIIPMKATSSDIEKTIYKRDKELKRKEITDTGSVDLPLLVLD